MPLHKLAGKPAPRTLLVNISRLVSSYYTLKPDMSDPTQQVAFGTSGHRGSSFKTSFNENHILAISQAICEYRKSKDITGPLFIGMVPHALSEPALATALEVFAANGMTSFLVSSSRMWICAPTARYGHSSQTQASNPSDATCVARSLLERP